MRSDIQPINEAFVGSGVGARAYNAAEIHKAAAQHPLQAPIAAG